MSRRSSTNRSVSLFAGLLSLLCLVAIASFFIRWNRNDSDSSDVSWLYSQTADTAELDTLGDGKFRLIMRGVDLHTVQFSDRPNRLVEILDTSDFVHHWDRMFATSLPNAVLVEHEPSGLTDSLVVVLDKPQFDYEADELTYELTILADEMHPERLKKLADAHDTPPTNMRAVSLFIDSVVSVGSDASPIFTGPAADALKQKLGLPSMPTKPVSLGGGVTINSATVSYNTDGSVAASATVGFGDGSLTMVMNLTATDSKNWTLTTAAGSSNTVWKPAGIPGLTIDPSSFTGTISSVAGKVTFDVTMAQHSWVLTDGATLTSTPRFSSTCPLDGKCPEGVSGPYLTMNGNLAFPGQSKTIALTGGINATASWIRFDGVAPDTTFGTTSVTAPTLTVWRGPRSDSYNADMNLPSLQKLSGGVDMEFCGGFTISIPKITNKATSGCVRWSPSGVVIGQVGLNASLSGSMPSTGSTASASSDVKGLAWTNLSSASLDSLPSVDAIMNGVAAKIQSQKIVLAGKATLPGVAAKALGLSDSTISVDVTGSVSPTSFDLTGTIPVKINIGSEPFKIKVDKVALSIAAQSGNGASFSIGTNGTATVGYSPQTRDLSTSMSLVAATAPQSGMSLSVTARGTAAPGETNDGLTAATALSKPSAAQYVWPDQFGIKGMNLWNLTVQIAYTNGSPALGYTSTSYMDPKGSQTKNVITCGTPGSCTDADWMVGTLGFNISYTNPCFAYQFDSAGKKSAFAIDGGVLKATKFAVGIAPTGCKIQSGSQQMELPAAFAGFQFSAGFGDATLAVATKVSTDGFVFDTTLTNLKLAGITYKSVNFHTEITTSSSEVSFKASMVSGMGDMDASASFAATTSSYTQTLEATMTNWGWKKSGTVDLPYFHFKSTADINKSCASFSSAADGKLTVGSRTVDLIGANFAFDCNGINNLYLKIQYDHKMKWSGGTSTASLELSYPYNGEKKLFGDANFSYQRTFSAKYKDRRFRRGVDVTFDMRLTVDTVTPSNSAFSFEGDFDADRVSGKIGCNMDGDGNDFTCGGELRLNPSWAGVYHADWGDL